MPQNSSRGGSTPPDVMTWRRAALVLVLAVLFDAIRAFFQFFWFFGPALAALYCANKAAGILSTWSLGILGVKTAAALCAGAGVAAGAAAAAVTAPIGVIMGDAVGLIGFLTLGLLLILTNARIVRTVASAPWYFAGAFMAGEVPFLGAIPLFSITLWRLYGAQIKAETATRAAWERDHAALLTEQRRQQAAAISRMQQTEALQMEEQEAANDAVFAQEQEEETEAEAAANDEDYRLQSNG